MRPERIFDGPPPYLWQIERYKPTKKWAWRAWAWGFFWGGILFLTLGYTWGHLAGKGF